jgi:hypothetical protein
VLQDPARPVGGDLDAGDVALLTVEDRRLHGLAPSLRAAVHRVEHGDVDGFAVRYGEGCAVDERTAVTANQHLHRLVGGRLPWFRAVVCVQVLSGALAEHLVGSLLCWSG